MPFKSTTPVQVNRSRRVDRARGVTTGKAGKIIPLRYIPLLREDRLSNTRVDVSVELSETVRPLANAVYLNVEAWFVPFAASSMFNGLDDFNRAYAKVIEPGTGVVKPFIYSQAFNPGNEIWKSLGVHGITGAQVNYAPVQAYNILVNHLYQERSPNLPVRGENDGGLAVSFWESSRFAQVVPNYDRSLIDGVVPLEAPAGLPVRGLGITQPGTTLATSGSRQTGLQAPAAAGWNANSGANAGANSMAGIFIEQDPALLGILGFVLRLAARPFISLWRISISPERRRLSTRSVLSLRGTMTTRLSNS